MKTLWRTRRDAPIDEPMPVVDQSLAESLSTRAVKPAGAGTGTGAGPGTRAGSARAARPVPPVAHWVSMPASGGGSRLEMVWEIPNAIPAALAG